MEGTQNISRVTWASRERIIKYFKHIVLWQQLTHTLMTRNRSVCAMRCPRVETSQRVCTLKSLVLVTNLRNTLVLICAELEGGGGNQYVRCDSIQCGMPLNTQPVAQSFHRTCVTMQSLHCKHKNTVPCDCTHLPCSSTIKAVLNHQCASSERKKLVSYLYVLHNEIWLNFVFAQSLVLTFLLQHETWNYVKQFRHDPRAS